MRRSLISPISSNHVVNHKWPRLLSVVLLCWWLGICGWGCGQPQGPPQYGMVQEVVDGDTIKLVDGRSVRYLGIDTPEMGRNHHPPEFLAQEAKEFNKKLVQNQKLRLEYDVERYDQYGRVLAYIFLPDKRMVNAELIRQGLAQVYLFPPNVKYRDLLVACQRQALEARQGLWQRPLKADEPYYVGNSRSFRFHRPHCRGAKSMAKPNRIIFDHPRAAYLQGYSPCKMCRP
ncbi:MAG: hypothetical protein DRG58_02030 [Deltaproteobacteria bacterium]|nr:MAG: hypothetical protein DRG58_02030 [Deltaproteobacteria bacterium]